MIKYKKISSELAYEWIRENHKCVILDVRTKDEFALSHIKNAVSIPMYEIYDQVEERFANKNQLILVYCEKGIRSRISTYFLWDLGYENVYDFGGLDHWPYDSSLTTAPI